MRAALPVSTSIAMTIKYARSMTASPSVLEIMRSRRLNLKYLQGDSGPADKVMTLCSGAGRGATCRPQGGGQAARARRACGQLRRCARASTACHGVVVVATRACTAGWLAWSARRDREAEAGMGGPAPHLTLALGG